MNEDHPSTHPFEPERYELQSEPAYRFNVNRRQFFKVFGGGLVVVCITKGAFAAHPFDAEEDPARHAVRDDIGAWLHIDEEGTVTVYTGKVEVGQNIRTSLAQVVAEELRQPFDRERPLWEFVVVEGLDGDRAAMVQKLHHAITDETVPAAAAAESESIGPWEIEAVYKNDEFDRCAISRTLDDDIAVTFVRTGEGLSLMLSSPF